MPSISFEEAFPPVKSKPKSISFEEAFPSIVNKEVSTNKSKEKSILDKLPAPARYLVGSGEAALNAASGMIAKPVSDVMGIGARISETANPQGGDPEAFMKHIRESMTYEPRGTAGKNIAEYNPVALVGKGVSALGNGAGNLIEGKDPNVAQKLAGNFTREAINQIPQFIGAKKLGQAEMPKFVKTEGIEAPKFTQVVKAHPQLTPEQANLARAQQQGFVFPGTVAKPSIISDFLEGHVVGKAKTEQGLSLKNARLTPELAKKSVGIPEDVPLDYDSLHEARKAQGQTYQNIKDVLPNLDANPKYIENIKNITGTKYNKAIKEFPSEFKNKQIDDLKNSLFVPNMSTEAAMQMVQKLRADAKSAKYSPSSTVADKALADAKLNGANSIEELMEDNLKSNGHTTEFNQMKNARKVIAQTYMIQKAMTETGHLSMSKLAKEAKKIQENGGRITDGLEELVNAYKVSPRSFRDMTKVGLSPSGSPLTAAAALHAVGQGHPLIAAGIAGKGAVRPLVTSDWYQKNFATLPQGVIQGSPLWSGLIPPMPKNQQNNGNKP